ncbi:hypothetical protein MNAN1_001204 [Malassezia nana]|uniref:Uncharacterized protein n=1 Tax=Malassezia nana TaxID=180528 RepID=A0AAF0J1R4_9BASI|nr:hypothetical protein MNAN1_001204 [Malassezia nana]
MWRWIRTVWGAPGPEAASSSSSSDEEESMRFVPVRQAARSHAPQETRFNPPAPPVPRDWDVPNKVSLRKEAQQQRHAKIQHLLARKGMPPELIQRICMEAGEGLLCTVSRDEDAVYSNNANAVYVTTPPLSSSWVRGFVLSVTVDTWSHDQGWSSELRRDWLGTYQGSYTWWELTLDRPSRPLPRTDAGNQDPDATEEIHRVHVCHNIHASREYKHHTITFDYDHPLVRDIQQGDRLSLWVRTQYPGWCNFVRSAQIHVRFYWT